MTAIHKQILIGVAAGVGSLLVWHVVLKRFFEDAQP